MLHGAVKAVIDRGYGVNVEQPQGRCGYSQGLLPSFLPARPRKPQSRPRAGRRPLRAGPRIRLNRYMNLWRVGTVLCAALLASGCYRSAVPLVAEADLAEVVELRPGRYCAAAPDWSGQVRLDPDDCRDLAFDPDRRVYVETRDWENADWSLEHHVARLADGFYLTEIVEAGDAELPYTLAPFVASAEGFAVIADVGGDGFGVYAGSYADVATGAPGRFEAGVVIGGDPARARTLIELAARADAAAWLAGEGAQEALVIYVRVDDTDGEGRAMARYAAMIDALNARFPRLRR